LTIASKSTHGKKKSQEMTTHNRSPIKVDNMTKSHALNYYFFWI